MIHTNRVYGNDLQNPKIIKDFDIDAFWAVSSTYHSVITFIMVQQYSTGTCLLKYPMLLIKVRQDARFSNKYSTIPNMKILPNSTIPIKKGTNYLSQ